MKVTSQAVLPNLAWLGPVKKIETNSMSSYVIFIVFFKFEIENVSMNFSWISHQYQADVHAEDTVMSYYGLTENEFKSRCSNHKTSLRDKTRNKTTLSSYIWKLKDREIPRVVNWSIK